MRKVLPGMFNKGESATSGSSAEQVTTRPPVVASPAKPVGPIKARSAANWKRPQPAGESAPPSSPPLPSVQTALSATVAEPGPPLQSTPESAPAAAAEPPKEVVEPSPAKISQETVSAPESTAQPHPSGKTPPVAPDAGPSTEATVARDHPERQHRRSTRSKRGQERAPTTDVFGTVAPPAAGSSTRTSHHRRKPGPFPSETAGPFAGMSALALKTLTTANTLKNQQQVAVLKTEVVRKEGPRPDSPTTKVRTALDRQREERVQQRKERAERRARRSAGDETGEGLGIGVNEAGDASFMSVDHDPEDAPGRHRRGPGDEEDYETPPRPERPAKRARFEGAETDAEKEKEAAEKRVKWDKGLHTTVYLDDSPPKPKRAHQAVPTQKSCLAAAAKVSRRLYLCFPFYCAGLLTDDRSCAGAASRHAGQRVERRAARARTRARERRGEEVRVRR
ncbi:hypothetical protein C8Q70DRAFT_17464 [Cubamyces menziesii]|nr:hypothetical protein C8Q70DRAFT_17464 [Cubamyces menziesii]